MTTTLTVLLYFIGLFSTYAFGYWWDEHLCKRYNLINRFTTKVEPESSRLAFSIFWPVTIPITITLGGFFGTIHYGIKLIEKVIDKIENRGGNGDK